MASTLTYKKSNVLNFEGVVVKSVTNNSEGLCRLCSDIALRLIVCDREKNIPF